MKNATLIVLAMFTGSAMAEYDTPQSSSSSYAAALAAQGQAQRQSMAQTATGGNASVVNDHRSSVSFKDRVAPPTPRTATNCINGVCRATPVFTINGGHDEGMGSVIGFGVSVPFGGGGKATARALAYAAKKQEEEHVMAIEAHQAEMASMCMVLHTVLKVKTETNAELFDRCAGFEHHKGAIVSHSGHGDPRQVSPH